MGNQTSLEKGDKVDCTIQWNPSDDNRGRTLKQMIAAANRKEGQKFLRDTLDIELEGVAKVTKLRKMRNTSLFGLVSGVVLRVTKDGGGRQPTLRTLQRDIKLGLNHHIYGGGFYVGDSDPNILFEVKSVSAVKKE
jgi:hypothetical protein